MCTTIALGNRDPCLLRSVPRDEERFPDGAAAAEEERALSIPDVKFERAARHADGGYEVRGKGKNGKVRDIELDANGKVIEVE